jgi:protein O-GlcNAc transferase
MKSWFQKLLPTRAQAAPTLTSAQERRQGNDFLDQGNLQAAIACYQRALALDADDADAYISLGYALQQAGQLEDSLSALTQARQRQAQNFDAAYLSGQVCAALKKTQDAAAHFEQALTLQPHFESLYGELCQAWFESGETARALSTIEAGIKLFPRNAALHFFGGNVHFQLQAWDSARQAYIKALQLDPHLSQAYGNLAAIYQHEENWQEALTHFDKALGLHGQDVNFHIGRATSLFKLGQAEAALQGLMGTLSAYPDAANIHQYLGFLYLKLNRRADSERHSQRALALNPGDANAHSNLGTLQASQGRFLEAEASYQRACDLQPSSAVFQSNLGGILVRQGRLPDAIVCFRKALALDPEHPGAVDNLLLALSADPGTSPEEYVSQARQFGTHMHGLAQGGYTQWQVQAGVASGEPLRVGFISADLSEGAVGYFLEGVVRHVDAQRVQLFAYHTAAAPDALSLRMQPHFAAWKQVFGMTNEAVAKQIHDDGIHILVDLNGHAGGNSLPVFALKPAPLQVSWLGYWASTGLPTMDFVLADEASVPLSDQGQFTEVVHYLPHTRHCFTPPVDPLPIQPLPALKQGFVTFGSYQSLTKIHEGVLTLWGRVLQAVPQSRLHLTSHQVSDEVFRQQFHQKLKASGIDPSRVTLQGPMPRRQYLESYAHIDMVLDTFPYTGGTTTCEALWMGVPTLTLRGNNMIGRQGVSMLGCVGLQDWIAEDEADYVAKASAHASDIEALQALRHTLRERALSSPLFDTPRFAKDWEHALFAMWSQTRTAHSI